MDLHVQDDAEDRQADPSAPIDMSTTSSVSAAHVFNENAFPLYHVAEIDGRIAITIDESAVGQLSQGSVCLVVVTGAASALDVLGVLSSTAEDERSSHGDVDKISAIATWGTSSATDRETGKPTRLLYLNLQHIYQQCNIALAHATLAFGIALSSALLYVSAGSIADTDVHHIASAVTQATACYGSTHCPRLIWLEQYTSQNISRTSEVRSVLVNDVSTPSFGRASSPDTTLPFIDDIRSIYSYMDKSNVTIVELQAWDQLSEDTSHRLSQLAEVRYILLGQLACREPSSSELVDLAKKFASMPRERNDTEDVSTHSQVTGNGKVRAAYRRAMSNLLRDEFGGSEQQWKIDVDAVMLLDGRCPLCKGGSEVIEAAKNVTLINELQETLHRRFDACHAQAVIDARQEIEDIDEEEDAIEGTFEAEKQCVYDYYFLASLKANSAMLQVTTDSLTPPVVAPSNRRPSRNRSTSTPPPHAEPPSLRLARYTDILLLYFHRSWGLASCHVMSHFLSDMMRSEDALWTSRVEQLESRVISQEAEQRELRRRVEALTTENMQLHDSLESKMDKAIDVWAAAQSKQTQMEDEAKSLDAKNRELKQQLEILAHKLATSRNAAEDSSDKALAVSKQSPPPASFADALKFVFACAAGLDDVDPRPRAAKSNNSTSPASTANGSTTE